MLVTLGTRPEAIKLAPVIRELRRYPDEFLAIVCSTGQHQSMLESILLDFSIQPDIRVEDFERDGTLGGLTVSLLARMDAVIAEVGPDWSVVQGDTSTALAATMASFYAKVPVMHVEAGLRTYDMHAPFPEEFNRKVISIVAAAHFAPTRAAASNLESEGVDPAAIMVTGNTVVDALLLTADGIRSSPSLAKELAEQVGLDFEPQDPKGRFVLLTIHRRENLESGVENFCLALQALASRFPGVHFVFPVHLNPRVKNIVNASLAGIPNLHLCEPLGYQQFVFLLLNCHFVITDSGGIQEEAPSLGKPVLVLRDVTERPEAVDTGAVKLVGTAPGDIVAAATILLQDDGVHLKASLPGNPYGSGDAANQIVSWLRAHPS